MTKNLSELQERIIELKKKRNALILAHNYQTLDIQEIADFTGDSLQLARKCEQADDYDMIIFSGVKFMAEMASVLSHKISVYIPDTKALCPLAAFVDSEKIKAKKEEYPDAPVIVYVNTTADTKSETDVICTSGSAVEVVESLGVKTVLFGPDANLADYVRSHTDVEIIDIEPRGHCYVHNQFDIAQLGLAKEQYPDAIAIAHPECPIEVQRAADMVGSTGMMVNTVAANPEKTYIIATEMGLVQQLQAAHPETKIIPLWDGAICRQMKKHTLEKILHVLEDLPEENLVIVEPAMLGHIKSVLEQMNKVKGQGPATEVHVPS
ncbi:MAG: quinolinate synthase NadA [Candidatus Thorarchaeota archaeon]